MRKWFVLLSLFLPMTVIARNKVVYGKDNRVDIGDSAYPIVQDWGLSVAGMVDNSNLQQNKKGDFQLTTYAADDSLCVDEPFYGQRTASICSGFLIAPDLLVTAAHCVEKIAGDFCQDFSWVFHLTREKMATGSKVDLDEADVYHCKKIIVSVFSSDADDFALVQLDRPVVGRTPLLYRKDGKVSDATPLIVLGYPTGLPLKVTDDAEVKGNDQKSFFTTNTDTFVGNSGSPVFNAVSGEVEGILVRGDEDDYEFDDAMGCNRPKKCSQEVGNCRGEDVVRITQLKKYLL